MKLISINIILVVIFISGCSTQPPVTSEKMKDLSAPIEGINYALPRALIRFSINSDSEENPVKLLKPEFYPDPNARYVLKAHFSPTNSDDFNLVTNERGLLESASANSTDLGPQIVKDTLSSISNILAGENFKIKSDLISDIKEIKGEFLIDPFSIKSPKGLAVTAKYLDRTLPMRLKKTNGILQRDKCPKAASICIPVMTPVILNVRSRAGLSFDINTVVPDPTRVVGIQLKRYPCVKSENGIVLKNGVLTSYKVKKDSEVAGCLSIPLDVVSAIISAPINAITGRTKKLEAQKSFLDKEKALLEAQANLLATKNNNTND